MTLFIGIACFVAGMSVGHWFKNRRSRYLAKELEKAVYFADAMRIKNVDLVKKLEKYEGVLRRNCVDEMRIGLHEAVLDMCVGST